jgi:AcrR family transcriptional regulator
MPISAGKKRKTSAKKPIPKPSTPRSRLLVDERREQLLALGMDAFSRQPYDDISIDDLAQSAGVSKGLLYHYFPSKKAFYVAILMEAANKLTAETEPDYTLPPPVGLHRALEHYFGFVEQRGMAYGALMRGGVGSDAEVYAILEGTRQVFVDRVLEGLPTARTHLLEVAVRGWIGSVEASALSWYERQDVPKEKLIQVLVISLGATLQAATDGAVGLLGG